MEERLEEDSVLIASMEETPRENSPPRDTWLVDAWLEDALLVDALLGALLVDALLGALLVDGRRHLFLFLIEERLVEADALIAFMEEMLWEETP